METEIITGLIALIGVILSVIISYFSNKQILKAKINELETQLIEKNSERLIQNRLESYPNIYFCLSEMAKKIKRDKYFQEVKHVSIDSLIEFFNEFEQLDSKHGFLFNSQSGLAAGKLRGFLINLINSKNELEISNLLELKKIIGHLEFSLKQEVGVYIEELQNLKIGKDIESYRDVSKYSTKIGKLKSEYTDFQRKTIENADNNAHIP